MIQGEKKQEFQTKNIYACANLDGEVEDVFYMIMDSKNKKNYYIIDHCLEEIPMNDDDYNYMPVHMNINELINIYNSFSRNVDSSFKQIKIKDVLTEKEVISTIYSLDYLLRDSFLQVTRKLKQGQVAARQKTKTLVQK